MFRKNLPPSVDGDDAWEAEKALTRRLDTPRVPSTRRPIPTPQDVYVPPSWVPRVVPIRVYENTSICQVARADSVPASFMKELALGRHVPTAWLDLHGYMEGDAWLKLMNWISAAYDHKHRCVGVITGKGRGHGPDGRMGVIKAQVPQWLASHPRVMAFHTAQPKDGGGGSLYVYLQRQRVR